MRRADVDITSGETRGMPSGSLSLGFSVNDICVLALLSLTRSMAFALRRVALKTTPPAIDACAGGMVANLVMGDAASGMPVQPGPLPPPSVIDVILSELRLRTCSLVCCPTALQLLLWFRKRGELDFSGASPSVSVLTRRYLSMQLSPARVYSIFSHLVTVPEKARPSLVIIWNRRGRVLFYCLS